MIQGDQCSVRYTIDVQYTGSIEHTQSLATSSAEEPSCPVCLGRFFQHLEYMILLLIKYTGKFSH